MVPTISHPIRRGTFTLQKRMRGSASRNSSTSDDNSLKSRSGFNRGNKVRYLDTSGPSMARRSTRPWERRHLLSTDWGGLKRAWSRRGPVVTSFTQGIDSCLKWEKGLQEANIHQLLKVRSEI